jgi:hypothetical protein
MEEKTNGIGYHQFTVLHRMQTNTHSSFIEAW